MTTADVRCTECGYDLRGLAPQGACPECGKQIELSLLWHHLSLAGKGPPLSMATPAWVRSLGTACLLFTLAAGWQLVLGVTIINPWGLDLNSHPVLQFLPHVVGALIALVATWLLTGREPLSPRARGRTLRVAARVSAVTCFLVYPAVAGMIAAGRIQWVISAWSIIVPVVLNAIAAALVLAYLARVAGRAERPALRLACRAAAWTLPPLLMLQVLPPVQYLRVDTPYGYAGYGMLPVQAAGHTTAVFPLAWATLTGARIGWDHLAWLAIVAASLFAAGVFLVAGRTFRRIAAGSGGNSAANSHP